MVKFKNNFVLTIGYYQNARGQAAAGKQRQTIGTVGDDRL